MNWYYKDFDELSLHELYALGRLRQEVFVVEQDCPYVDFDGRDDACYHLLGVDAADQLQAYARLVPAGISYAQDVSIGRVITSEAVRGTGAGKTLMWQAIEACEELWPHAAIRISAQTYLLRFYQSFGFVSTGKEYLEDGIPHTEMLLKK